MFAASLSLTPVALARSPLPPVPDPAPPYDPVLQFSPNSQMESGLPIVGFGSGWWYSSQTFNKYGQPYDGGSVDSD